MLRTALQPRWLALLAVSLVLCVAFGWLGWWQLGVARERGAERAAQSGAGAASIPSGPSTVATGVPLEQVLRPQQPFPTSALRPVVLAYGSYDPSRQVLVGDRVLGGQSGLWVVAALHTTQGAWLPVVRGWVSSPDDPGAAVERTPKGTVQVRGLLRPDEAPVEGQTSASEAVLSSLDAAQLVNRWGGPIYNGFLVAQTESTQNSTVPMMATPQRVPAPPVRTAGGQEATGGLAWRNAAYAVQWWVFAGFTLVLWWKMVRQDGRERAARERERVPA